VTLLDDATKCEVSEISHDGSSTEHQGLQAETRGLPSHELSKTHILALHLIHEHRGIAVEHWPV
jgi:hypothetical protein